ncbi:MAG TPA: serine hydrolase domain-containing protein [Bacteroidia bacterium]|nr:serine hydrolase domain-containing protein [Bacteroidia bacterium]
MWGGVIRRNFLQNCTLVFNYATYKVMCLLFIAILSVCLIALASYIGIGKPANIVKTNVVKHSEKPVSPPTLSKKLQKKQFVLDSIFSSDFKKGVFNGCVAVSHQDTLIYQSAMGFENIVCKKNLCNESVFQLASVSKMFTAVAVLKLVEQNKLALKDNIKKYFPDFPYQNITIENLLSHTSGIPNYLYFYYHLPKQTDILTNAAVLDLLTTNKPAVYFKPGRRFQYNNTNYVLLALLVEKLSGQSFQAFVKQNIFDVCGMSNSYFFSVTDTLKNQALAFDYRKRPIGTDEFDWVVGDKGVCSTPQDMLLFGKNLFEGKVISNINEAVKPRARTGYGRFYGLGFRINPNGGDTIIFHNGWWHGYRTAFQYRKSDKTIMAILSNRLDKNVYQTARIFNALDNKVGVKEGGDSE